MAGKALGIVLIRLDGTQMHSENGATLETSGVKRTPVNGAALGDTSYSEEAVPGKITFVLIVDKDFSATTINAITNSTAVFEADTGQSYICSNCFRSGDPVKITGGQGGKVNVELTSPSVVEQKTATAL